MAKSTFDQSLGGKPIVVTTVNPNVTDIDIVPGQPTSFIAYLREYTITLSNMGATALVGEVHFNNSLIEVTIPAHDTRTVGLTVEGDSASCTVASGVLRVTINSAYTGTIHVTGGYDDGRP